MDAIAKRSVQDGRPAGHLCSRGRLGSGPQLLSPKPFPGGCWRGWPHPRPHPPTPGPGLGPLPGLALPGIARHRSTCRPGVRPHAAPMSRRETWTALSAVRSWRRRCHVESGTRRSPLAEAYQPPAGSPAPSLCPLPALSPHLRAEMGPSTPVPHRRSRRSSGLPQCAHPGPRQLKEGVTLCRGHWAGCPWTAGAPMRVGEAGL